MIGLDTNILVRYLTQDDPIQSPKATEIIERRLTEEKPRLRQHCRDNRDRVGPRPCV
jgi:predicted nucleic-acid-binding protein